MIAAAELLESGIKFLIKNEDEEAMSRSKALGLTADRPEPSHSKHNERGKCSNLKIVLITQSIALRID